MELRFTSTKTNKDTTLICFALIHSKPLIRLQFLPENFRQDPPSSKKQRSLI